MEEMKEVIMSHKMSLWLAVDEPLVGLRLYGSHKKGQIEALGTKMCEP